MNKDNITFIGMPGAGKSTVGVVVAKLLCKTFIDADLIIQNKSGKRLHTIIEEIGNDAFLQLENDTLAELFVQNSVISTGGSAIFGTEAMEHLKKISTVVYIKVPYEILEARLGNLKQRGVIFEDGQTLRDVYDIRTPLYEKYADVTIEGDEASDVQDTAMKIVEYFEKE
jgi:shikimate kinase